MRATTNGSIGLTIVLCETVNGRKAGWSVALNASGNTAVIGSPDTYNVNKIGRVNVWSK